MHTDTPSPTDLIDALTTAEKLLTQLHAVQIRLLATLAGACGADPRPDTGTSHERNHMRRDKGEPAGPLVPPS